MLKKMTDKQKQMTAEFVGTGCLYHRQKEEKRVLLTYLAKNTALSVKSAKAVVDSVYKLYEGENHE